MGALKHVDRTEAAKARTAWGRWMTEKIHVATPEPADLEAIPADLAAAAMLYRLPPGWCWVGDEPEPPRASGGGGAGPISSPPDVPGGDYLPSPSKALRLAKWDRRHGQTRDTFRWDRSAVLAYERAR